jgi:hypothetical protein
VWVQFSAGQGTQQIQPAASDRRVRVANVTGVKVFSATKAKEREGLGEQITEWLRGNPNMEIVDKIVTQSSDSEFHCLTITFFYRARERSSSAAA